MPIINVSAPVSSAPSDRLALGIGWVRPGVAGFGGALNPAGFGGCVVWDRRCFEGSDE